MKVLRVFEGLGLKDMRGDLVTSRTRGWPSGARWDSSEASDELGGLQGYLAH